jgi:hypothetical protein
MAGMNAFALLEASENDDPAQISASIPMTEDPAAAAASPAKPSRTQAAGTWAFTTRPWHNFVSIHSATSIIVLFRLSTVVI